MPKQAQKKKGLLSYILIVIGALMASFSVALILLPNDAIDYGTAGVAIIISKLTGFHLSLCVLAVFLPFVIAGYVVLGRSFTVKAALGSLVYTVGLAFFEKIPFELNTEHFLAVAFGGAILGAGLSLILRNGGCIDGSEILANIVVKKLSDNTGHFEAIKQVTIITQDPDGIIRDIREKMHKTCTIMESRGAIAGENNTLICYISYFELPMMKEIISTHSGSFSTVSTIDEILR